HQSGRCNFRDCGGVPWTAATYSFGSTPQRTEKEGGMTGMRWGHVRWPLLAVAIAGLVLGTRGIGEERQSRTIRIGMVGSLFRDIPDGVIAAMSQPFNRMMSSQTGMTGELVKAGDCQDLARQLSEDNVQLGLFHGIEFAWARQKYPEL